MTNKKHKYEISFKVAFEDGCEQLVTKKCNNEKTLDKSLKWFKKSIEKQTLFFDIPFTLISEIIVTER